MIKQSATFSPCNLYRYDLWRIWKQKKPYVNFVCLNPSTADANFDDPTIRRCIGYAADWGYGGMVMTNIFAYRSTDPKNLKHAEDPIGKSNDTVIRIISASAGLTIMAWGVHGAYLDRGYNVLPLLRNPHYLDLTKERFPKHPLYLKKSLKPKPFEQGE